MNREHLAEAIIPARFGDHHERSAWRKELAFEWNAAHPVRLPTVTSLEWEGVEGRASASSATRCLSPRDRSATARAHRASGTALLRPQLMLMQQRLPEFIRSPARAELEPPSPLQLAVKQLPTLIFLWSNLTRTLLLYSLRNLALWKSCSKLLQNPFFLFRVPLKLLLQPRRRFLWLKKVKEAQRWRGLTRPLKISRTWAG